MIVLIELALSGLNENDNIQAAPAADRLTGKSTISVGVAKVNITAAVTVVYSQPALIGSGKGGYEVSATRVMPGAEGAIIANLAEMMNTID